MKKIISCLLMIIIVLAMVITVFGAGEAESYNSQMSELNLDTWDITNDAEIERFNIEDEGIVRKLGEQFHNESVNEICIAKYRDSITVCGKEILLYPTFVSQDEALNNIKRMIPELLDELADTYSLDELKASNLDEYEEARCRYITDKTDEITEEKQSQVDKLETFINIYGHVQRNKDIQSIVSSYTDAEIRNKIKNELSKQMKGIDEDSTIDYMILRELEISLPSYSITEYDNISEVKNVYSQYLINAVASTGSFNISNGISYASKYANTYNSKYPSFSSDCTNFASQILYEGGQEMVKSENFNPYEGWFMSFAMDNFYSRSWTVADQFVKFWRVTYESTKHGTFSKNIKIGDFIAYDRENDGLWNHVGFVTNKEFVEKKWGSHCYYDYKVAQHTSNYHLWTSNSANGWDNLDWGTKYAIVRP